MTLEPIIATPVSNPQRTHFWQAHFGTVKGFATFEVVIFTIMGQFCEEYTGSYWEYCTLTNGGAFIYPDLGPEKLTLFNMHNGNETKLSAEAAGVAVCLMLYSMWSFRTESELLVERFYQLRDYTIQHPESSGIFHLID
ncbi:TPA: antirestriction protein [Providencia stuartii]|uniref:Antirestriction protein n=1 Tax=Providencia huashanensis TaxID=3037798 RepID=A0ABT9AQ99_9GAMM|nr:MULTISPECIES: antirestriction protein [Providencia]AXO19654.1 antirestriction protein [Providencia stuartii]MBN5591624.1 antirestriction protein [Providencia stuartii]MDO7832369.1 antirestriction protein [Providencia sp. CRE-138-0026]MDO7856795.1 antirestriction protein [Providencia sp. CRE-138-0111]HEM6905226.1 antirestriction protein [Providencia stuartii]